MQNKKHVHIVSFDVPYPPNYGGVIDVFHKVRCLSEAGIAVTLHCFEYGRGNPKELNQYCDEVYYYKRTRNPFRLFNKRPFIVTTRSSEKLKKRLLKDKSPVLLEGLHVCDILEDSRFTGRKIFYRESNIEHFYYRALANAVDKPLNKKYFLAEAAKLEKYEPVIRNATALLVVNQDETVYFKHNYPENKVVFLPSFHENSEVTAIPGKGDFVMFHGNLSVAENNKAATYIAEEIAAKLPDVSFVIAGREPDSILKKMLKEYSNIRLIENPSMNEMTQLMRDAHIHLMITFQATGLKLKLLNTLYQGRFVIANPYMVLGSCLEELCTICSNPTEIQSEIRKKMLQLFTEEEIENRKKDLNLLHSNKSKTETLLRLLFS
ncbi:MAG: glycosyltransferase [Bacteroidota bacterium]